LGYLQGRSFWRLLRWCSLPLLLLRLLRLPNVKALLLPPPPTWMWKLLG
jgi:hypothetical protein